MILKASSLKWAKSPIRRTLQDAHRQTWPVNRKILRVKGYVAVEGKPMRMLVQAVGERLRAQYDQPWGATARRKTQLVVIAEHDDIDVAGIHADLGA